MPTQIIIAFVYRLTHRILLESIHTHTGTYILLITNITCLDSRINEYFVTDLKKIIRCT